VSHFYRRLYAERAVWTLRSYGCEVVQILNLLQLIPAIRRTNPRTKIVLHMECDWLAGLDRDFVDRHLRNADVTVGCSEFITDGIRRRFPAYAQRCTTVYTGVDVNLFNPRSDQRKR
jgi:hypothetical protein